VQFHVLVHHSIDKHDGCIHLDEIVRYSDKHLMGELYTMSLLRSFWALSIVRISTNQKTQRFGNWICFHLQAGGTYSTEKPKACLSTPPRRKTETDPVSEMLCFLVCRNLDDGQSLET
jgi:hypothetical protein